MAMIYYMKVELKNSVSGAELWINGIVVRKWVGRQHDAEAQRVAADLIASSPELADDAVLTVDGAAIILTQLCDATARLKNAIAVWPFAEAPAALRAKVPTVRSADWLAFVPRPHINAHGMPEFLLDFDEMVDLGADGALAIG